VIRYRFEFVGPGPRPLPDHAYRDAPIVVGTLELYRAERFLVVVVDEGTTPPVAILRKLLRS
jgi:hypothetical protein